MMRFWGLVCTLLSVTVGASMALEDPDDIVINYSPYNITWKAFKADYDRHYSGQEEHIRYKAFVEHLKMVEAHNKDYLADKTSFFMGIGPFADRIPEDGDFSCDVLEGDDEADGGLGRQKRQTGFCRQYTPAADFTPVSSLDWRTKGAVTPVGNQGDCGSCYSFGATATIEAQVKFSSGNLMALSQQQFVDCHKMDCKGSTAEMSFQYVQSAGGIMSEADYPYREQTKKGATPGPCNFNRNRVKAQVSGCLYSLGNEERLKHMVASQGPVYISFLVLGSLSSYKGGIYTQANCNDKNPTYRGRHCLTVVGYGSQSGKDIWIVKNSWGATWGGSMRGYGFIQRGVNMCGIANRATVPVIGGVFNRGKAVLTDTEPDTYSPTDTATPSMATVSVFLLSCVLSLILNV